MRKDLYTNGSVDLPKITKKRSFFDLTHSSHIDMNAGILYPIDQVIQIAPGDTFDYSHRLNIRMTNPPKTPTMDQLVFDIYFFYVPNRIVWDNWDKMMTNYSGNYYVDANYTVPILDVQGADVLSTYYGSLSCSVLDYLGYGGINQLGAANDSKCNPSALPLRGYCKIWNEYFRFEPLQTEVLVPTGDSPSTPFLKASTTMTYYEAACSTNNGSLFNTLIQESLFANVLLPVNRLPGYFSRALPQPLAGDSVKILSDISIGGDTSSTRVKFNFEYPLVSNENLYTGLSNIKNQIMQADGFNLDSISGPVQASSSNTIQALSNAFALNKFLYIDNLYGKRITEWTYGHFGVNVPDSRVQRPEFLAKKRVYININQIMQSSETGTSPQGNAGAWSQTFDAGHDFTKSFVEFGYLHTMGCIRVLNHTFAQGVDRHWSYRTRYDYMLPEFANVGDQPVYKREIYFDNLNPLAVWGYQERFAEYKMIPSRVAGLLRPQATGTLALWTYTDYYASAPTLSASWIMEPRANIDNTLYIGSNTAPSFILDYVADIKSYRTLPYNSMPGGLTGSW